MPTSTNALEVVRQMLPERVAVHFPVEHEPRIPTLDAPLVIESAYPGWQLGGERYPAVPGTVEEQVKEIVDSVKAGAAAIHVHPRDPRDGIAKIDANLLRSILDPVFDKLGDVVTLQHTWDAKVEADYVEETELLLELGKGNKYCQGSVVLPVGYRSVTGAYHSLETIQSGVRWLEQNRVKPIFQLYDTYTIWNVKQHLIDHGIATWEPFVFNLHLGKHHAHAIHKDPWSYLNLITNYNMVDSTAPNSVIGVYPGGRNWLPILTLGIMMGCKLVRVGIEDCYWVYPHKDEIIAKNSEVVKMAVDIAHMLGRRVVTDPEEARQVLGMELTSKA